MTARPLPRAAAARCATAAVAVSLPALLLAACGDGAGSGDAAPTVTVTASTSGSPSASPTPTATTDVKGRAYDLGTITQVSTVGDETVVEIDRWTAAGMADPELAKQGVEVAPHRGQPYSNQNARKTYTAIVAPDAQVVVNTCVVVPSGELGMTSDPRPAATWLKAPDRDTVLAIRYDADGRVVRMDTDPVCR